MKIKLKCKNCKNENEVELLLDGSDIDELYYCDYCDTGITFYGNLEVEFLGDRK